MFISELDRNVIVRPRSSAPNFGDAHAEEITVYAESFAASRPLLPRGKEDGSYRLTYINTGNKESTK